MSFKRSEVLALEHALEDSQQDFARLLASLTDWVFQIAYSPAGEPQVLYSSPNTKAIFGTELEVTGNVEELFAPMVHPDDKFLYNLLAKQILLNESAEGEYRVIGTDGITRWIWTRVNKRFVDGWTYFEGIASNITEKREFLEERTKTNQFRLDMVAMLSAKIGNALAGSVGFTELALRDTTLSPETRHYIETVKLSGERVDRIRRDVLALCTIDAGQLIASRQPLNLFNALQTLLSVNNVKTELNCESDVIGWVNAVHFGQIIENLLNNADRFAGGITSIDVTVNDENRIQIRIRDNGPGIKREDQPHLFDRNLRANDVRPYGVGVGLFVARSLAEANEAEIWYESSDRSGATFVLELEQVSG